MKCPYCGYSESKVIDSRPADENSSIRRRRECLSCGKRFTTYEIIESLPIIVVKRDKSREAFDREKLLEFNKIHPTFDENRLVVKPNPVTVPSGPVTPWEERKRQFVFAGRLEELKGLRTVIEAWRILGKDAPLLLVAGDGPLADWAKAQNLPKVQFVGQLPRDALHRLMAESRAVVAASLCYESFALVPAEAHALGTPVLASGIGNVGASVRPGFNGLCFAPGDPAALAGAVRAMSAMQFDCTAISNATCRRFSAEENYKTLLKLYGRRAAEEVS